METAMKLKAKRSLLYIVLVGISVIGTWATMTIIDLREDNMVLEERLDELKVQKTTLQSVQAQLEEENVALENHPLR